MLPPFPASGPNVLGIDHFYSEIFDILLLQAIASPINYFSGPQDAFSGKSPIRINPPSLRRSRGALYPTRNHIDDGTEGASYGIARWMEATASDASTLATSGSIGSGREAQNLHLLSSRTLKPTGPR